MRQGGLYLLFSILIVDLCLAGVAESVAPLSKSFTNSIGMNFVLIPAGSFIMGSLSRKPGTESNEEQYRVTISKPFYMQTTEVTRGQWNAVMGTQPWSGKRCVRDNPECPAVYVSWNDCQEFIRRMNQKEGGNKYHLPTEAQWEYACRAGSTTRFCFGDSDSTLGDYAWYDDNASAFGQDYSHRVGTKKANAWGLYDMHGNVWELCQDWYGRYPLGHVIDPMGPSSGPFRVIRGGSWCSSASQCQSAYRDFYAPRGRYSSLGFRLASTP